MICVCVCLYVVALEQQSVSSLDTLAASTAASTSPGMQAMMTKRPASTGGGPFPGLNSLETMQKSVMNAFALKYSERV